MILFWNSFSRVEDLAFKSIHPLFFFFLISITVKRLKIFICKKRKVVAEITFFFCLFYIRKFVSSKELTKKNKKICLPLQLQPKRLSDCCSCSQLHQVISLHFLDIRAFHVLQIKTKKKQEQLINRFKLD